MRQTPLHWKVPYDVVDEAGNSADTVWRDVMVEEVDLEEFETKIRQDVVDDRQALINAAVKKAVEEDRRKRSIEGRAVARTSSKNEDCACDYTGKFDEAMCNAICEKRMGYCAVNEYSWTIRALLWLESFIFPSLAPVILFLFVVVILGAAVRWLWALLFAVKDNRNRNNPYINEERQRAMRDAVQYFPSAPQPSPSVPQNGGRSSSSPFPPRDSLSLGSASRQEQGIFSPHSPGFSRISNGIGSHQQQAELPRDSVADIYITPSKRGEGVRRRSPGQSGDHHQY